MFQENEWEKACLPAIEWHQLWELFHENSKLSPYGEYLADPEVAASMRAQHDSVPYRGFPERALEADASPPARPLLEVLGARVSSAGQLDAPVSFAQLGTLLQYAYGVTRVPQDPGEGVSFRTVPSAGALYPLDLFVLVRRVEDLAQGMYHFDPHRRVLTRLGGADVCRAASESFVQRDVSEHAAVMVVMAGMFRRVTFKYGARGYRFALIEAGHVAQNLCLVSTAFGLGSRCLGGFMDRELDRAMDLDGVHQSALYAVAIGGPDRPSQR